MAPKVMLISAAGHVSGPAKGIFQLMENMDRLGLELVLFTFEFNRDRENLFREAARDRGIPVRYLIQDGRSYLSLVRQVVRIVRTESFDVVQTHGFKPTFLGFFARMLTPARWVCFMHGATRENVKVVFFNWVDGLLQRGADVTVLVSEAQRPRVLGGRNRRRVWILRNAVDPEQPLARSHDAAGLRESLGLPASSLVVTTLGRFSPEKGMDVLVEAFAILRCQREDVHLVLVGDGQEREGLEARVRAMGLSGSIHFPGFTETPGDFLHGADVFVLPSRSEGLPNAILEAMAMGVPVVATDVGGVSEIVEDRVSGWLVPSDDPEALAEALARVLENPELRERLAKQGRYRVEDAFSIEARLQGLRMIYQSVL